MVARWASGQMYVLHGLVCCCANVQQLLCAEWQYTM